MSVFTSAARLRDMPHFCYILIKQTTPNEEVERSSNLAGRKSAIRW